MPNRPPDRPAWACPVADLLLRLDVDPARGLSTSTVGERQQRHGKNQLPAVRARSAAAVLWAQFENLVTVLLLAAALVSLLAGEHQDAIAIGVVILLNATLGFVTEIRATRSMESLRKLVARSARVRRDGAAAMLPAEELVPGDIVLIEGGDVVAADLRCLEASRLQASEALLTGESMPIEKSIAPAADDAALSERSSMLFQGTAVTRGAGVGVVVTTGLQTELGAITALVARADAADTPFERRLDQLGRRLMLASLVIAAVIGIGAAVAGRPLLLVVQTAVALAVATIPEGLPIVATMALARGMWRMARRNALIEKLSAVETLGSTSVVLTDKTGTLTEDRMTLTRVWLGDVEVEVTGTGLSTEGGFRIDGAPASAEQQQRLRAALQIGALCTDAELPANGAASGDPLEVALLVAAAKASVRQSELKTTLPELRAEAFDPATQRMATWHRHPDGVLVAVKGALEAVLPDCTRWAAAGGDRPLDDAARAGWVAALDRLAATGLRLLALASKIVDRQEIAAHDGLTLHALVALMDPPRPRVAAAVAACRKAGIRVVMVTGDHPATAASIACAVGLVDREPRVVLGRELQDSVPVADRAQLLQAFVFARTTPEQKLRLIEWHQAAGEVVAMIGDGVNDAPALRQADIGIAMGIRGTEVARAAAAMVLRDDELDSVVAAVEQGRVIVANVRLFLVYLLSCNLAEILTIGTATALGAPLPITPLQILFLNLVTDVLPALALGVGPGDPDILQTPPPRRGTPLLLPQHWLRTAAFGALLAAPVLTAFWLATAQFAMPPEQAVTVAFLTLAAAQLFHLFNMPARSASQWRNEVTRNPWVWAALLACILLLLAAVYLPVLAATLRTREPGATGWSIVLIGSMLPMLIGWLWRAIRPRTQEPPG